MKRFLKKRWRGLPIGILAVVLALMLATTGVVFAAFTVISGETNVTVEEAITVEYSYFGTWTGVTDGFELTLEPYYPGESDIGYYRVYSLSQAELPVSITITGVPLDWTLTGDGIDLTRSSGIWSGTVPVPPATVDAQFVVLEEGCAEFTITMTTPTDVEPTLYIFQVAIARE